jgi:NADH-quinone oxidoreductase subunit M
MSLAIPNILSLLVAIPVLGALVVYFVPGESLKKWLALGTSLITFVLSLVLWIDWESGFAGIQFEQFHMRIPELNLAYHVGVDGISLFLVLLTTFLMPIAIYFSNLYVKKQIGGYLALMLVLEAAMIGSFISLDMILFFAYFEFTLIPMYFLIGHWGGQNRRYAAQKFFIYTFAGSALMLVAILAVFVQTGTFDMIEAARIGIDPGNQLWIFVLFALAFAVKVPLFPFHTWLPDAHVQAPTAGSIILAGVLLKLGTYGYVRMALPIFPDAATTVGPVIAVLAIIGILYGALVALVQEDIKSLVAYSSVAHLGFVMLGVFALNEQGISGAVLQMVNHGLSTGALFLLVGLLYERRHTRMLSDYGGLWKSIPIFCGFFLVVAMSSAGLPGLNGFVGEFTILLGMWMRQPIFTVLAALGVILAAWYLLTAFRRMAQGPITDEANSAENLPDLRWNEIAMVVPLVVLFFVIGLFPNLFLDKINPSVAALVDGIEQSQSAVVLQLDEAQVEALALDGTLKVTEVQE